LLLLTAIGRWLGLGLANLTNVFNPAVIVLGGWFLRVLPFLEGAMLEALEKHALKPLQDDLRVIPSQLGAHAPVLGAAEMALSSILADPGSMPGRATEPGFTASLQS